MAEVDIPHFSFPFQRGSDGKVEVVEQDTQEHIMSCVQNIVACPLGYRQEAPDFGWQFPEFGTAPLDLNTLAATIGRFEPRAEVDPEQWQDLADAAVQHFRLNIKARLTEQEGGE